MKSADIINSNTVVTIVGLARTGMSTARFCLARGSAVKIFEQDQDNVDPKIVEEMKARGAELIFGKTEDCDLKDVDLVVPSPGVPPASPILRLVSKAGIPILSEVELASKYTDRPIVAVTGTNGKTTTATLIGRILEASGLKPSVAGNIGHPLIEAVQEKESGPIVTEVSSFQLEYTYDFRPRISVLLNIKPDHIDWHGDIDSYIGAKLKIFQAQTSEDWAVVNQEIALPADAIKAKKVLFGEAAGVFAKDGWICQDFMAGPERIVPLDRLRIRGEHNRENVMAAAAAAMILEVESATIAETVASFRGIKHRLEFVADLGGVKFFNDSKATNPDATIRALNAFDQGGIILLAGGRNKGNPFSELAEAARGRVTLAVLFGEAAGALEKAFRDEGIAVKRAGSLEEAVDFGGRASEDGDIVLLSPACASQDMFADYEERGRVFKGLVEAKAGAIG